MPETRLRLTRRLDISTSGNDYLAVVADNGQVLLLNESAHYLVTELQRGIERVELRRRFAQRFELDPDLAAIDVDRALFELANEGLLDHDRL